MQSKKVALITGGTRGIGLGIAEELARSGFDLALTGRRQEESCVDALTSLRATGVQVHYFVSDVSAVEQHTVLLDAIQQKLGGLHALVNNAGIAPRTRADILDAGPSSFDELIGVNLRGPYFLTQQVARRMRDAINSEAQRRCIINVGSISATLASVDRGDYCIAKAGIGMATQLWAVRLAEFGIDVFELRPGLIATDMTSGVKGKYDDLIERGLVLEKRWGTPSDVGKAAAMLVRNELPYATGSVLTIDGGLSRQRL
jgi:NAD(P)-dependent dehydrogenase (short-subunit alcohol dehydrogenase family)